MAEKKRESGSVQRLRYHGQIIDINWGAGSIYRRFLERFLGERHLVVLGK